MISHMSDGGSGMLALFAIAVGVSAIAAPQADQPGLTAQWLFHGVDRPVMIEVRSPRSFGTVTLALLDAQGDRLAEASEVHPGLVDLAEVIPDIWNIRRTSYLQLMDGEQPAGSALVLQPMLSRMVPVAEQAINPNGIRYTRIVGWYDELHPPAETEPESEPKPKEPPATNEGDAPAAGDQSTNPQGGDRDRETRLFSGLRIYPERDVVLHTSKGDIRLAMRPDEAPNTVWNFLTLCEGGFYRDVAFHRVVPMTRSGDPFVIQAGDPTHSGNGGPGYWLPLEPSGLPHEFGVISMARDVDPDSAGSQFFICLSREGTARLDGHYCAFGYAVDGAETIRAIADVALADASTGRPVDPPVITHAELIATPPRVPGRGRPDRPVSEQPPPAETRPDRVPR